MAQDFSHLLLTLFNVRIAFAKADEFARTDWLEHRFQLFESFCYPSVRGQTNQNFRWIVLFDSRTPKAFRDRIEHYSEWDNFQPYFIDDFESFKEDQLRYVVFENSSPGTSFLITTRLDNDDALSIDYLQSVQDSFASQDFEFINFPKGYVLSLSNTGKVRLYQKDGELSNPFISLIESNRCGGFRTLWGCGPHDRLRFVGNIRQVDSSARWLQVVHGRNVRNSVEVTSVRIPVHVLDSEFVLKKPFDSIKDNQFVITLDNSKRRVLAVFLRSKVIIGWYVRKLRAVFGNVPSGRK